MGNIKDFLSRKMVSIDQSNYHSVFKEIAEEMFNYYGIRCGDRVFRFAEIEFYYYDKDLLNDEWNRKTYPRSGKAAGELFFHYSGIDVCFESNYGYNESSHSGVAAFGGILIRSLYEESAGAFVTGPLLCMNTLLNACAAFNGWMQVVELPAMPNGPIVPGQCNRFGISYTDHEY